MPSSRMFEVAGKKVRTWNIITGCLHGCSYCWARRLAETKLKDTPRYKDGFKPAIHEAELSKRFKPGEIVFISDMGDMWGEWVPVAWITAVLGVVEKWPETTFLFLTKNPARYHQFKLPPNCFAGATIESTYVAACESPPAWERYVALAGLDHPLKFVSVEPIMDFMEGNGLTGFLSWLRDIGPKFVYIGMDNYNSGLPEPRLAKTKELIAELQKFTEVRIKTLREANA